MSTPRFHVERDLPREPSEIALPEAAARHAQVLRLQPGNPIVLFDGSGGEWDATILQIARHAEIRVRTSARRDALDRELALRIGLAIGVPANERMDTLVEKATELGVASVQPLLCERGVLRLSGERAQKKALHWRAVAVAACEQSGRSRVPAIAPMRRLDDAWLADGWAADGWLADESAGATRWVLSLRDDAAPVAELLRGVDAARPLIALSGPEGGLTAAEEDAARSAGFVAVSLGPRVLRADTAPLALLAQLALVPRAR